MNCTHCTIHMDWENEWIDFKGSRFFWRAWSRLKSEFWPQMYGFFLKDLIWEPSVGNVRMLVLLMAVTLIVLFKIKLCPNMVKNNPKFNNCLITHFLFRKSALRPRTMNEGTATCRNQASLAGTRNPPIADVTSP